MPIKPENRPLYPDNWAELRQQVGNRANHRCEWCGAPDRTLIRRNKACPSMWLPASRVPTTLDAAFRPPIKVVLTTAHLDRKLTSHNMINLAALCQRCHLALDKSHNPIPKCFRPPPTGGASTKPNAGET